MVAFLLIFGPQINSFCHRRVYVFIIFILHWYKQSEFFQSRVSNNLIFFDENFPLFSALYSLKALLSSCMVLPHAKLD